MRWLMLGVAGLVLAGCAVRPPEMTVVCRHSGLASVTRKNLPADARKPDGSLKMPDQDGFGSPPLMVLVLPGQVLDRFGDGAGRFLSPAGTSFAARALQYQCSTTQYHAYRVLAPFEAQVGSIAKAFGEAGGGEQIVIAPCVDQLVAAGVLAVETGVARPACGAAEE